VAVLNSDEFIHGYNDGFSACSVSNDNSDMEDKNDTLNENKIPVMSSQRATYIMNVCTGHILIEDTSVMDIVAVSNFVYHISQWQSVTPT
jgi:hypothetical protein